jgi:peptidoglycan/LPS O-acetylase OafA/YrhL
VSSSANADYRPEIDGLRAVAVILVMLYHAGFTSFSGGYIGVDVFFVISGYLMTCIISGALAEGRFSLIGFVERRVRRIIPALMLVMSVSAVAAWLFLLPGPLESFSASLLASTGFVANFYFWRSGGSYFAPKAVEMPLWHLWSLAVEEQFYIVFPIFLLLVWRLYRHRQERAFWAALAGSFAIFVIGGMARPGFAFFLLPTRAWEFLSGGIIALAGDRMRPLVADKGQAGLATLGLAMILMSALLLDPGSPFPWPHAIWPVVGTSLLLAFATPENAIGRGLGSRLIVAIGLISYSAYLWHQPVLVFARAVALDPLTQTQAGLLLVGSLGLAALSWRIVEQPFRRRGFLSQRGVFAGAGIAAVLLGVVGAVGLLLEGAPERLDARDRERALPVEAYFLKTYRCGRAERADIAPPDQPCHIGIAPHASVAVFGDSHASILEPALVAALAANRRGAADYTHSGCPPVLDDRLLDADHAACSRFNRTATRRIIADPAIDTVVIASAWFVYVGYAAPIDGRADPQFGTIINTPAHRTAVLAAFSDTILRFIGAGKHVVLVYPVPQADRNVPQFLIKARRLGLDRVDYTSSYTDFRTRNAAIIESFDALGNRAGLMRIRPDQRLCAPLVQGRCRMTIRSEPLYFDNNHLTPAGVRMAMPDLTVALRVRSH